MKRHVFRCVHQGWDKTTEGIWFDADYYTEDEARAQFVEVEYMGVFNEDNMPEV